MLFFLIAIKRTRIHMEAYVVDGHFTTIFNPATFSPNSTLMCGLSFLHDTPKWEIK